MKDQLRFLTCGSVDDGKSTLIGRLLFESESLYQDQLMALEQDSKNFGTQSKDLDFALLLDGLVAEREQGITIDVAFRYFSTEKRKFIVADSPGHEQYTRNMATAASTADLAVVLVDARKGILTQTRRHSFILSLMGIKQVILAVNKMDLINFDQEKFQQIVNEYVEHCQNLGFSKIQGIPVSALKGENLFSKSDLMPWHQGPHLIQSLEEAELKQIASAEQPLRFPVQLVARPNANFRGYAGTLVSGHLKPGDSVRISPSGMRSRIREIITADGPLTQAQSGQAVTLTLEDEIDVSRGDVISADSDAVQISDQFEVDLIALSENPIFVGRSYWLKIGTKKVSATLTKIKYKINVNTLERLAAHELEMNSVSVCNISTDQPICFDPFDKIPATGRFILIDRVNFQTIAAGMIHFSLKRADNLHPQDFEIKKSTRALMNNQKPCVLWFTGLSGSGKSTLANIVERKLFQSGFRTYILDGDNLRQGLNRDLGFTENERVENIRRTSEVAKLMTDAGLITLVTLISPFATDRQAARSRFLDHEFFEIFVDTSLAACEKRDPKGLYKKARAGQLKNMTGLDSAYDVPDKPDLHIRTENRSAEDCAESILKFLKQQGIIF